MTIYVFHFYASQSIYGLTQNRTGGNLPLGACQGGNWKFNRTLEINLGNPPLISGLTAEEIITNIERDGYYIVDITIQTSERVIN